MNNTFLNRAIAILDVMSVEELHNTLMVAGMDIQLRVHTKEESAILRSRDIIEQTEQWISYACDNNHDFTQLLAYHDTLDVPTMSVMECAALLRSCFRVHPLYPNWFKLRKLVIENLSKQEGIDMKKVLRGLLSVQPMGAQSN